MQDPQLVRLLAAVVLACPNALLAQDVTPLPGLQRARAVWFVEADEPIGAEVCVSFETRPWTEEAAAAWNAPSTTRLALADGAWAEFATFTELRFGKRGQEVVAPGVYYMVLERNKDRQTRSKSSRLLLLDPDQVRAARIPPGTAEGVAPIATITLSEANAKSRPLGLELAATSRSDELELRIQHGPHRLLAKATVTGAGSDAPLVAPDERVATGLRFSAAADDGSPLVVIDHGRVSWGPQLDADAANLGVGDRWRLGKDWATTLDSNVALLLGDEQLQPGAWHLALERTTDGWKLIASSAEDDCKAGLDAYATDRRKALLEVPLHEDTERLKTADLMVTFVVREGRAHLVVGTGSAQWIVPVALVGR